MMPLSTALCAQHRPRLRDTGTLPLHNALERPRGAEPADRSRVRRAWAGAEISGRHRCRGRLSTVGISASSGHRSVTVHGWGEPVAGQTVAGNRRTSARSADLRSMAGCEHRCMGFGLSEPARVILVDQCIAGDVQPFPVVVSVAIGGPAECARPDARVRPRAFPRCAPAANYGNAWSLRPSL